MVSLVVIHNNDSLALSSHPYRSQVVEYDPLPWVRSWSNWLHTTS